MTSVGKDCIAKLIILSQTIVLAKIVLPSIIRILHVSKTAEGMVLASTITVSVTRDGLDFLATFNVVQVILSVFLVILIAVVTVFVVTIALVFVIWAILA